jgi:hypothetical protein
VQPSLHCGYLQTHLDACCQRGGKS